MRYLCIVILTTNLKFHLMLIKSPLLVGQKGTFVRPELTYAPEALTPVISQQTIEFHYGKHLQAYVNQLNTLVVGSPYESLVLEEIVAQAPDGALFNNAGQVVNHVLYFEQFRPAGCTRCASAPTGKLAELIRTAFGTVEALQQQMNTAAVGLFGSGWLWLAQDSDGGLLLIPCANGDNPVRLGMVPLLGIDVWEHAYYLDYQNRRADHVAALWSIIDWDVVASRLR